ncbi:MAG: dynamin family protein [Planctomycetaceae bacterium]|jgi:GTPase SAR1 family protein|nr:dynamin family protein [Planctomycetaceae bacterium]
MINFSNLQIDYARILLNQYRKGFDLPLPSNVCKETAEKIESVKVLTDETIHKLEHSKLRLAFIGATSSGKSTFVNALLGKVIAPTEAQEMSAGVLQFFNADHDFVKLSIAAPAMSNETDVPEELWKEFDGKVGVEEAEAKIRTAFDVYHHIKKTTDDIIAPQIQIYTRLLLAENPQLLQLPEGVKLEIIDLPGIHEINDAANLKVVQDVLTQAVLVVVLNYDDTAQDRLNVLLKEVGEVVRAFQSCDSIFFVLNKVDRRNKGDNPLDQTIKTLKDKIVCLDGLNDTDIAIVPVSAIQLMQYQYGIGYPLQESPTDAQLKYLASGLRNFDVSDVFEEEPDWMFDVSRKAKKVTQYDEKLESSVDEFGNTLTDDDKAQAERGLAKALTEFRKLFNSQYNEPPVLTTERLQMLLDAAWKKSGGGRFIEGLRQRIQEHLPRLVIQPAIHDWQTDADDLATTLNGEYAVALKNTKEELDKLLAQLEQTQVVLSKKLQTMNRQLKQSFGTFIDALRTNRADDWNYARSFIDGNKIINPFISVFDMLENIGKSASSDIFGVLSDTDRFAKLKAAGCSVSAVNRFVDALEGVEKIWNLHTENSKGDIKLSDDYKHPEWDEYKCAVNAASAAMVEMLSTFFSKRIQGATQELFSPMSAVSANINNELFRIISEECQIDERIAVGLVPSNKFLEKQVPMSFDMNTLRFPDKVSDVKSKTKTWATTRDRTWSEWADTWFGGTKKRFVTEEHSGTTYTFKMPGREKLTKQWDETISSALPGLCQAVAGWFETNCGGLVDFLDKNARKINGRYQNSCKKQQKKGETLAKIITAEWESYKGDWNASVSVLPQLQDLINTGNVPQKGGNYE